MPFLLVITDLDSHELKSGLLLELKSQEKRKKADKNNSLTLR